MDPKLRTYLENRLDEGIDFFTLQQDRAKIAKELGLPEKDIKKGLDDFLEEVLEND